MRFNLVAKAAPWAALGCFVACSSSSTPPGSNQNGQPCTSGATQACSCSDGSSQTQSCGTSGTYDACPCPNTSSSGSGGGSGSGSGSGGGSGGSGGSSSGTSGGGSSGGSSSGSNGGGVDSGTSGGSSDSGTASATEPKIPDLPAQCPTLAPGMGTMVNFNGQPVEVWVGTKQTTQKGKILLYWHGTGSVSGEADTNMDTQIREIVSEGGIVASFTNTTKTGLTINNAVWYTGDIPTADAVVACAVKQLNIDTHQIYAAGCSAGGLMAGSMAFLRSSYIAAAMPNSGGIIGNFTLDSPHVPAVITAHGPEVLTNGNLDMVTVYFQATSLDEDNELAAKGGFEVDCNHGQGHCGAPHDLIADQWTFCKAHPFGVSPEPYASGLPASFPSYCSIVKAPATDGGSPYACRKTADCSSGQACCLTPGPFLSSTMGESSACKAAGPVMGGAGGSGQCPSGFQLCASDAECGGGLVCNTAEGGYCTTN